MVLFLEGLFCSKVAPTEKCRPVVPVKGGSSGGRGYVGVAAYFEVPQGLLVLCSYSCFCTGRSNSLITYRRQLRPRLAIHTSPDLWDN